MINKDYFEILYCRRKESLSVKEMPLEEKYDKLLDSYLLNNAINYAFHKELGVISKHTDFYTKVQEKLVPSYLGTAFKMFKKRLGKVILEIGSGIGNNISLIPRNKKIIATEIDKRYREPKQAPPATEARKRMEQ